MRIYNWDSFDVNFPKKPYLAYAGFEWLGFEFVFNTGDMRRIMIKKDDCNYLLENLGGGCFTVNDSVAIFSGSDLYQYLKELGNGNKLESIAIHVKVMPNRFKLLRKIMERVA